MMRRWTTWLSFWIMFCVSVGTMWNHNRVDKISSSIIGDAGVGVGNQKRGGRGNLTISVKKRNGNHTTTASSLLSKSMTKDAATTVDNELLWNRTAITSPDSGRVEFPSNPIIVDKLFNMISGTSGCATRDPVAAFPKASLATTETALDVIVTQHDNQESRHHNFFALPEFDAPANDTKGGVAIFRDAYIQGKWSVVYDCHTVYVPGGCLFQSVSKESIRPIEMQHGSVVQIETAILIAQYWGEGFFHSMIEGLPRLALVMEYLRSHPDTVILSYEILMNHKKDHNRHKKVLNPLLGLDVNHPWIQYHPANTYHVERLLVPTATSCGKANPIAVKKLQQEIESRADSVLKMDLVQKLVDKNQDLQQPEMKKLIVVQKRSQRGLTNHKELIMALRQRFTSTATTGNSSCCHVIEFDDGFTMKSAASIHHSTTVMIGPHGAGFSNAIFMKRNKAAVIEIHPAIGNSPARSINYCQQHTAIAAGLEARILIQKNITIPWGEPYPVEDIPLVLQTVEELLKILELKEEIKEEGVP